MPSLPSHRPGAAGLIVSGIVRRSQQIIIELRIRLATTCRVQGNFWRAAHTKSNEIGRRTRVVPSNAIFIKVRV